MEKINILVIEDEPSQIQMFEDVIKDFNEKNEIEISFNVFENYNAGEEALKTPFYDAAIIDLKLSSSEELEGRKLVESVHEKIRIPIIIYSGSISQVDDIEETVLLKKCLRTEKLSDLLSDIVAIYKTGITRLLRPSGELDTVLTNIFWNQLAKNLGIWIENNNSKTLLRHIFTHFQEHMDIDVEGNFEEYHPAEIYISPPIKKNIHTGDLIETEDGYFFVITPACDLVFNFKNNSKGEPQTYRKADNLVVAQLKDFDVKTKCLNGKGEIDKNKIYNYTSNRDYRYHYLPSFEGSNDGFIIDFQNIRTYSFESKMVRFASVSGAFKKEIIARFSLYYARQGQPTFINKGIAKELYDKYSN